MLIYYILYICVSNSLQPMSNISHVPATHHLTKCVCQIDLAKLNWFLRTQGCVTTKRDESKQVLGMRSKK